MNILEYIIYNQISHQREIDVQKKKFAEMLISEFDRKLITFKSSKDGGSMTS